MSEGGYKKIGKRLKKKVEAEVKMLLHASRDCLRNQGWDTTKITFKVQDGYYGEAFGVMRGLTILGYGYFGPDNLDGIKHNRGGQQPEHNFKWWFSQLTDAVLDEENYDGSNECDYCLEKYGKDGAVRRRR
jgi:hypothetical protein